MQPTTIEKPDYGVQGWGAIDNSNWEKINDFFAKLPFQNPVLDKDLATPPGSPTTGARYIVATGGTGAWSGKDKQIAQWTGTAWYFVVPSEGFKVYVLDENIALVHDGTNWVDISTIIDHSALKNLSADTHAQYALLAGRDSGQTLKGGTASGENLTLQSTNHATKGKIMLGANSAYDEALSRLGLGNVSPTEPLEVTGNAKITGEIKHTGNKVGFYNATPVLQPAAYTIANDTPTRTLDVATATLADVANVLATLIRDNKAQGLSAP